MMMYYSTPYARMHVPIDQLVLDRVRVSSSGGAEHNLPAVGPEGVTGVEHQRGALQRRRPQSNL